MFVLIYFNDIFVIRYVQSFLHTVIGAEDQRWWIGLHAEVSDETGITWHWESGDPVTYDNWGRSNPSEMSLVIL